MPKTARRDAFAAIADPTRRRLLERLAAGERSVTELTDGAGVTVAAISLHLQTLRRAGLVSRRVAGRQRYYRLEAAPLREITEWATRLSAFWEERTNLLQELAEKIDAEADRHQD
ncbi:ArsR/SmtB family transcription factor [Mesorhizobium sp. 1B3]|uniref:ArsR/SmtB family transcription factor n=1 Tax=Mesorhizobium sp. 1B3 TaxID=3243599 RepID=UPI003D98E0FD